MKITRKSDAKFVSKPDGTDVWYFLFPEYELHYNEIKPGVTQVWHRHDTIEEVIFIVSGEMLAEWVEDGERRGEVLHQGDLSRSENSVHTFTNTSNDLTKFIVVKLVLKRKDSNEIFKTDKRSFAPNEVPGG